MSTVPAAVDRHCSAPDGDPASVGAVVTSVRAGSPPIVTLIRDVMGPYLTHGENGVRRRATEVLAAVLDGAEVGVLGEAAAAATTAAALLDFFTARLKDYPSVGPCFTALTHLLRLVPGGDTAPRVAASIAEHLHVPAMEQNLRQAALTLLSTIASSSISVASVLGADVSKFVSGFIQAMDAEKDPRCLLVALDAARHVATNFGEALSVAPGGKTVIDELFDVTACYFPISFTPPKNDTVGITQDMLATALRSCITSSRHFVPPLVPLIMEKLSSSIPSAKVEACTTLQAALLEHGVGPMASHIRELLDSLRAEGVLGSDEDVTDAVLQALRVLASAAASHAQTTGSGHWATMIAGVVDTCTAEVGRSADSLVGRASGKMLSSVAGACGAALGAVLDALQPVLQAMFEAADRGPKWPALVSVLADVLSSVDPHVDYPAGKHPLQPFASMLHDVLLSAFTSPGCGDTLADSCVEAAARGLAELVSRPPTSVLAPDVVSNLVARLATCRHSSASPVVQIGCLNALKTIAKRPAFQGAILESAVPVFSAGLDNPASCSAALTVLADVCQTNGLLSALLPMLLARAVTAADGTYTCTDTGVAAPTLTALGSLVAAHTSSPAAMDACADAVALPLVSAVVTTAPSHPQFVALVNTTVSIVRAVGSSPGFAALRADVVNVFLGRPPAALPTPPATFEPFRESVPAVAGLLTAAVGWGPQGELVDDANALVEACVGCVAGFSSPTASPELSTVAPVSPTSLASAQCLAAVVNRAPRATLGDVVAFATGQLLPVAADATAAEAKRCGAIHGLAWVVKGAVMAGHWKAPVPDVLAALRDLLVSPSPTVAMTAATAHGVIMSDPAECLSKASGAMVKPTYKQRLFMATVPALTADKMPADLAPPALLTVASVCVHLPPAILLSQPGTLPLTLVALSCEVVEVRVAALATLRVFVEQGLEVLRPHVGTVIPKLLGLTTFPGRPVVRAYAIDCLAAFTQLPYAVLSPLRSQVVRGLAAALDDSKRAVRRRAAACRNDWITLSTQPF